MERKQAWATIALIAACVAVYIYQVTLERQDGIFFILEYGMIPDRVFGTGARYGGTDPINPWATLVTSLFLHSPPPDYFHIILNMIVLLSFGTVVERWLGWPRFLLLYFFAGICSSLLQAAAGVWLGAEMGAGARIPVVGASGAILGLLGYAMVIQPRMQIVVVIIPMPIWIAMILLVGVHAAAIVFNWGGGIAWWGHLGGLIAGFLFAFVVRPRFTVPADWDD